MLWLPRPDDEIGDAALAYAARGWAVFPLKGKEPITPNGFKDATSDLTAVAESWAKNPTANIGGPIPKGLFVLDEDPRHGGDKTRSELEAKHGPLPFTLRALTGGGGFHWLFNTKGNVKQGTGVAGAGLDTRVGGKGYIVLPPSLHPDTKRRYEWYARVEPVDAPDWLIDLVKEQPPPERKPYTPPQIPVSRGRRAWALAALRGECQAVANTTEGGRNARLYKAACRLFSIAEGGLLDKSEVESALREAGRACGLSDREVERTIR